MQFLTENYEIKKLSALDPFLRQCETRDVIDLLLSKHAQFTHEKLFGFNNKKITLRLDDKS